MINRAQAVKELRSTIEVARKHGWSRLLETKPKLQALPVSQREMARVMYEIGFDQGVLWMSDSYAALRERYGDLLELGPVLH